MNSDLLHTIEKSIGYEFRNKSLLEQAVTTKSFAKEFKEQSGSDKPSQESLRTFGDAILKMVLIDLLLAKGIIIPQYITDIKSTLEMNQKLNDKLTSLFTIGKPIDFFNKSESENASVPLYANTFESIICAIYCDVRYTQDEGVAIGTIKGRVRDWFRDELNL